MNKISKNLIYFTIISCFIIINSQSSLASKAQRIISLGPTNTENVFLLGAGKRLVGNTIYCVRPEPAKLKPKIGSVMQVSIEKIISLKPDLILATSLTKPAQVKQLEKIGYKVVRFKQPSSFAEICRHFIELGKLLNLEERARKTVIQAQKDIEFIRNKVAGLQPPKVFLQIGTRPTFGSTPESFTHDFIAIGGGINILADQGRGTTNTEKIIARNPDLIIIAIMGSETGIAVDEQKKWQKMPIIRATQAKRIEIINPNLVCSPSPATFAQTLRIIAKLIHPSLDLSQIDLPITHEH
jgi:iron complex transport system substrate-binding protein